MQDSVVCPGMYYVAFSSGLVLWAWLDGGVHSDQQYIEVHDQAGIT